ncbi:MAG TPA: SRPBCC domain-containing protein [Nocardioides sp.]
MKATLEIEHDLPAPPDRVWRALTEADELSAWFWPERFAAVAVSDPVVDGVWRVVSDEVGMAVGGRFAEVAPPGWARWTWRWDGEEHESLVSVGLEPTYGGTRLRIVHSELRHEDLELHREGWESCLNRLPAHLAKPAVA